MYWSKTLSLHTHTHTQRERERERERERVLLQYKPHNLQKKPSLSVPLKDLFELHKSFQISNTSGPIFIKCESLFYNKICQISVRCPYLKTIWIHLNLIQNPDTTGHNSEVYAVLLIIPLKSQHENNLWQNLNVLNLWKAM